MVIKHEPDGLDRATSTAFEAAQTLILQMTAPCTGDDMYEKKVWYCPKVSLAAFTLLAGSSGMPGMLQASSLAWRGCILHVEVNDGVIEELIGIQALQIAWGQLHCILAAGRVQRMQPLQPHTQFTKSTCIPLQRDTLKICHASINLSHVKVGQ